MRTNLRHCEPRNLCEPRHHELPCRVVRCRKLLDATPPRVPKPDAAASSKAGVAVRYLAECCRDLPSQAPLRAPRSG
uniref:Uncharacterized protein n=1 Tax=Arundo donax TaxID=35708 RepID=A0A0A9FQP3_ARUDO